MCSQRRTRSAIRSALSFGAGHLQRPRNDPGHVRPAICRRTSLLDPGGRDRHLAGSRRPTGEGPALPAAPAVVSITGEQMPAGGLDCTGAYILAQAGLLDGKRAATHWAFVSELSSRFPKVSIDGNPIWIRDGNVYSSGGVTSGIDLSLALVEEDHGHRVALEVARMLVVFLCRPGNQAQFSVWLREQRTDNRPLRDLQVWIVENLQSDLSTLALAARVAMSERNFQRVFTREIGKPPPLYVEELRLEAVRRKLEGTHRGLEEIASACGFNSADVMSRSFQRHFKTTTADYRACFRTSGAQPLSKRRKEPKPGYES